MTHVRRRRRHELATCRLVDLHNVTATSRTFRSEARAVCQCVRRRRHRRRRLRCLARGASESCLNLCRRAARSPARNQFVDQQVRQVFARPQLRRRDSRARSDNCSPLVRSLVYNMTLSLIHFTSLHLLAHTTMSITIRFCLVSAATPTAGLSLAGVVASRGPLPKARRACHLADVVVLNFICKIASFCVCVPAWRGILLFSARTTTIAVAVAIVSTTAVDKVAINYIWRARACQSSHQAASASNRSNNNTCASLSLVPSPPGRPAASADR